MKRDPFYFNLIANDFESKVNPFDLSTRLSWFRKQIDKVNITGEMVLDIGCGLGHFSNLVHEHGGKPVLFDIAFNLLKQIDIDKSNCVNGSALELPFHNETFKLVISSECIEHTYDPLLALKEMIRVLQPEGVLLITTPNHIWRWAITLAEILNLRRFHGIENWTKRNQICHTIENAGAKILVDEGLYLFPFQFRPLWPLLKRLNLYGQAFKRFMINQCWVAQKNPEIETMKDNDL